MKYIGITGASGFVGSHLKMVLETRADHYTVVCCARESFTDAAALDLFVSKCDTIVHLAGLNRHEDAHVLYDTNVALAQSLVAACKRTKKTPHIIFSSSSQEERDNLYGASKKEARMLLSTNAKEAGAPFTGMIVPNVFGPFGKPFYNSVIATFAHQVSHGDTPHINVDADLKLIYVLELVEIILEKIETGTFEPLAPIAHTAVAKVSEVLTYFKTFKDTYQDKGEIPALKSTFEVHLFNTYRCFMDIASHFPVKFTQHTDVRGSFVEIIRLGVGGQVSFSTTQPGVTRGNHYHTRKIERFAVIKGKALIQLRKVGTDQVLDFYLDGEQPAYVDMPIWYTHNIKNIGEDILYTNFWINEPYDPSDADTFFEEV